MNSEDKKRWLRSLSISFIIFVFFSLYLYIRRGYYDLYIINKILGSTAVVLAGITLFIGPLSKRITALASFMTIRRHLGLLAFGYAILHILASLYQTQRFTWFSWYLEEWMPVLFGLIAVSVWGYMAYLSRNVKTQQMGVEMWKNRLSLAGKVAFFAIFLHLTVMKYPGWIRWVNGQVKQTPELANPSYPPASLFVFIFMIAVILYRIFINFRHEEKKI